MERVPCPEPHGSDGLLELLRRVRAMSDEELELLSMDLVSLVLGDDALRLEFDGWPRIGLALRSDEP